MLLSQSGPGEMNLGRASCIVLHIAAHLTTGLSQTPQLSSAGTQPQLQRRDLAEGSEDVHPLPDAWGSSKDL